MARQYFRAIHGVAGQPGSGCQPRREWRCSMAIDEHAANGVGLFISRRSERPAEEKSCSIKARRRWRAAPHTISSVIGIISDGSLVAVIALLLAWLQGIRPGRHAITNVVIVPMANRPPVGVMPEWLWLEERFDALKCAILRYEDAGIDVKQEWLEERARHSIRLLVLKEKRREKTELLDFIP